MIELGGNIKLKGFNDLDPATIIVVKKIVGNYTKQLTEKNPDFSELFLDLSKNEKNFNLNVNFSKKSGNLESDAEGPNLFFVISAALEGLTKTKQWKPL